MSHPTWRLRLPAFSRVPRYTAFVASILLGNYDPWAGLGRNKDPPGQSGMQPGGEGGGGPIGRASIY
jgi:hypothetical protein